MYFDGLALGVEKSIFTQNLQKMNMKYNRSFYNRTQFAIRIYLM
jgi:hypothetical protein